MKHNIFKLIFGCLVGCGLTAAFTSCENDDIQFDDFEGGTTVYFPYQYPVRTIVLGDDEYDTTLDKEHKCQIMATFGGSYNGSNGSVQVAVDESLVNNLTFADGTPVKAMPSSYYQLSTTNLAFNGTFNGATTVQLTDAFFSDPEAVKNTYVIPLVMTSQSGFDKILTGELKEGATGARTDASVWDTAPMDYILYCVKFQNKYSGYWLTHGTTNTADIEKATAVQITTRSLNSSVYSVSFQDGADVYAADLLLTFDGSENCTISSLTNGVTATGNGSWGDDSEKKAWGNKDRDGMELNYTITVDGKQFSRHEKLVWQRSGVKLEEFSPVYNK
ncbi:MAG: DUF1735 domain-containing protein [Prevotella sp.]|nr:DUF1735 domain-containing protein [Prevotella sp.]